VPPTRSEFLFEGKLEGKSDSKPDARPATQPEGAPNSKSDNRFDIGPDSTVSGKVQSGTLETVKNQPYRETDVELSGTAQPVTTPRESTYSNADSVTILPLAGNDLVIENISKATDE
jgi:hypothetical protein